ncbi:MAG: hypothetical protein JXB88_02235 [Spirochaetales bacterium]|nr:hypothetical protein [Spirochaetales bacterium]
MKIKDRIHQAIDTMGSDELLLLYEQIQLIQHLKQTVQPHGNKTSIEDILQMTGSSKERWSDTVIDERRERI